MIRRYVSRLHSLLISLPLTFWILCGGTFINRLGMLIKPFLAIYLTSARHLPSDQVGLIVSLPGLGSIIASALIGILADRFSRKHLLVFGLLLSAALLLPIAFLFSPLILALLVLVWSIINEGPGRLSRMLVLDIVKPEQRRQAVSLLRVAINVGLAASTAVGGVIATLNFLPLFIMDAGTTVIFALLLAFRLPATVRPATAGTSGEKQAAVNVFSIFTPLRDQAFLKVWLSTLLAYM